MHGFQAKPSPDREHTVERWRRVWRQGLVLQFTTLDLGALRAALASDDQRLIQGSTTVPSLAEEDQQAGVRCGPKTLASKACLIGLCGMNRGLRTIGDVSDFYQEVYDTADADVDFQAFISWFDNASRERMRTAMLEEIDREIRLREKTKSGVKAQRVSRKLELC
jgi:hypothetical protein